MGLIPQLEHLGWQDAMVTTTGDPLEFNCPRCSESVNERFYGPCASCRDELKTHLGGEPRQVGAAKYEPKMNVTPNQVATKE